MTGTLFAIEGIGYTGKSTCIERLRQMLPEDQFVFTREPGGTPFGTQVREAVLIDKPPGLETNSFEEMLLMFADRSYHVRNVIMPALRAGQHVITDRFYVSTWGYQVYQRGTEDDRQLFYELKKQALKSLDDDAIRWILFGLSVEEALQRKAIANDASIDQFDEQDIAFWNRVNAGILEHLYYRNTYVVEASQPPDVVAKAVHDHILYVTGGH